MNRKEFIKLATLAGSSILVFNGCDLFFSNDDVKVSEISELNIMKPLLGEDIFSYITRIKGKHDNTLYKQILGSANEFKEGDKTLKVAAINQNSRIFARELLSNTTISNLNKNVVYTDKLLELIQKSIKPNKELDNWTLQELKDFTLTQPEERIKVIMPSLSSDVIACLVKIMTNNDLISLGQKIFNPLPNSKIGSKGYMGARVQPNSPTDNIEDISWQVFNAWSYAVGDVVLGTNPVSSEPESVAKIESALYDIISTFNLLEIIPNCVLSHIDIQSKVEKLNPGKTGIWFQSIASTVKANKTFDITIDKMLNYASERNGHYGLYAETGQGADLTNGHAEGFDMVIHESRKYGFLRVLKQRINSIKGENNSWVHVNDVAGFIGPEVFRTKEQLVRCCLEDTVMGKLHGLTIGLDICSTFHMDVNLKDLDWCIEQVMPANPAYLMALPTKIDPMLSYLTTSFKNHLMIREKFKYKVNDDMWDFFKKLEIIDDKGNPTEHFGDPIWVYYKYRRLKDDRRTIEEIYKEGNDAINRIESRGVYISRGYGNNYWELDPELDKKIHYLYEDAKVCIWAKFEDSYIESIPNVITISSTSFDRKDYIYHPTSGESLNLSSIQKVKAIRNSWNSKIPDVQIIISDGLNAKALMDEGHLIPYLDNLIKSLQAENISISPKNIVIKNGRVRAGYACGEILFGNRSLSSKGHGIIHIIGERPGTEHRNFSAYLTVAQPSLWNKKGEIDHDISRVISGISDTSLKPHIAVRDTIKNIKELFTISGQ